MNSILIKVNKFKVEYKMPKGGSSVEIYVDGNLNESYQHTWYLRELLNETIRLKSQAVDWRKSYEKLELIARDYINEDVLEELLEE